MATVQDIFQLFIVHLLICPFNRPNCPLVSHESACRMTVSEQLPCFIILMQLISCISWRPLHRDNLASGWENQANDCKNVIATPYHFNPLRGERVRELERGREFDVHWKRNGGEEIEDSKSSWISGGESKRRATMYKHRCSC